MRLIDADELKKKAIWIEERGGFSTLSIEIDDLRHAPTIDAVPVVHGRWTPYDNEQDRGFHYCSTCKGQAFNYEDGSEVVEVLSNFCPNCGAKMDLTDGE